MYPNTTSGYYYIYIIEFLANMLLGSGLCALGHAHTLTPKRTHTHTMDARSNMRYKELHELDWEREWVVRGDGMQITNTKTN